MTSVNKLHTDSFNLLQFLNDREEYNFHNFTVRPSTELGGRQEPSTRCGQALPLAVSRTFGKFVDLVADKTLGLFDDYLTNLASYRALLVLNHCTSRDDAKLFGKLGGMNPSSSCRGV